MEDKGTWWITFDDVFGVENFFNIAERYPNVDINVVQNRTMVDGKSMIGLMALDLSKPIAVNAISSNEEDVESFYQDIVAAIKDENK